MQFSMKCDEDISDLTYYLERSNDFGDVLPKKWKKI